MVETSQVQKDTRSRSNIEKKFDNAFIVREMILVEGIEHSSAFAEISKHVLILYFIIFSKLILMREKKLVDF